MHVGLSKGARDVRNVRCTSSDLREGRRRSRKGTYRAFASANERRACVSNAS